MSAYDTKPKDAPTDWMADAACVDQPYEVMFPDRGRMDLVALAKSICAGCRVKQECLDYARTSPVDTDGIWGGLTGRERRRVRDGSTCWLTDKRQRGTLAGYRRHLRAGEVACDECKAANAEYERRRQERSA